MQLLRDWVTAENAHDAVALGRILDDQFISTSGFGKPHSKQDFITAITKGKPDPRQSQTLEDETVVVAGDTLPLLCREIYGSPSHYLRVAQVNGLDDFRDLTAGQALIFPPFERARSG